MTIDELLAKLKALEASEPCRACGSERWEIQDRIYTLLAVKGDLIDPNEGLPCLVLLCMNCGNARFHSASFLEQA